MKKIILFMLFLFIGVGLFAQGWLFPIKSLSKNNEITADRTVKVTSDSTYTTHFIRPQMGVGGIQILYNKVTKEVSFTPFAKVGIGATFALYKVTNGDAFNYLNFNGILFFPIPNTETPQTLSIAVTASALHLFGTNLNPSVGINFEPGYIKSDYFPVGPLINLTYNF
jgi:hypothetical protein